jgi:hypothetical protein
VTQWKRAGLITLKSLDRNKAVLKYFFAFLADGTHLLTVYKDKLWYVLFFRNDLDFIYIKLQPNHIKRKKSLL